MSRSNLDDPPGLVKTLESIFGEGGLLSAVLPNYERRPQQNRMALAVATALSAGRRLLVEAGTGTGKTLGYLIPAILSGRKVLVSTGTKTLQDQLILNDLPFLKRHFPVRFHAVSLKGKSNYLCLYRYKRFCEEPRFVDPADAARFAGVRKWASETVAGDRSELAGLPEDSPLWRELSVDGDACLGQSCPELAACHLMRARQESAAADLVVVNHHLFFSDLALAEQRFARVLPHYDAVIFDEAHQLEETATHYFGVSVSSFRIQDLCHDAARELRHARLDREDDRRIRSDLESVRLSADRLFSRFRRGVERYRIDPREDAPPLRSEAAGLASGLDRLHETIDGARPRREGLSHLGERAASIRSDLEIFFHPPSSDFVFWCDVREKGVLLSASPIRVDEILWERLFSGGTPIVLTSATLSTGGNFAHVRKRLGIREAEELILDTPFDFARQAILYLPRHLPDPRRPEFVQAAAEEIRRILLKTRGRALLLFTSRQNLNEVHRLLADALPFPLLRQGDQPKAALIERFKREVPSVLFGTASFWQGIDLPGEALSCVVVDRLPFSPPTDPLVQARLSALEEEGLDPFTSYQIPTAVLTLKQGLGRLIRHGRGRGVLAVLDVRLTRKSYGGYFLKELPPCSLAHDLADLDRFLGRGEGGGGQKL
jgi:ATP-dependent DNA helicase DinG